MFTRTYTLILLLLVNGMLFSQAPDRVSYQAVIRNATGNLVTDANVGVRISIIKGTADGTVVYSETHATATNANGLASLQIGGGEATYGNFSTIDWSGGPYFLKVETDPQGGVNYTISGVSQLLSVPYALYAAHTKSQGKSTIYLTGDITNEEAAERIASEAGPNTENIFILDTSALTNVDFSGLGVKTLMNLKIVGNEALESVVIDDLAQVYDTIEVTDNSSLSATSFGQLTSLKALHVLFQDNPSYVNWGLNTLTSIRCDDFRAYLNPGQGLPLPVLVTAKGSVELYAFGIDLSLPQLQLSEGLHIYNAASLQVPALSDGSIEISTLGSGTLALNNYISGTLILDYCPNLTTLSAPLFTSGALKVRDCDSLVSLSLPSLQAAQVRITGCNTLSSVSFPALTSFVGNGAFIYQNPLLTSISFPVLANVDNTTVAFPNVSLAYNALGTATINSFLHQFLTVGTVYGFDLRQQPPVPPTGQGITDKQTLIAQGKNVLTD